MINREMANEFEQQVIKPLQMARDHCHWLSVTSRSWSASNIELLLDAILKMSYTVKGRIARGEE